MPTPPNRRIRYTLTAIGAVGLIGAGSAAIVAGSTSGEREIRLAATAPDAAAPAGAATPGTAAPVDASTPAAPSARASGSAVPSASAPESASASASASASPVPSSGTAGRRTPSASTTAKVRSQARPKPSATRRTSAAPAPEPTRTTEAPSGGGGDSSVQAEVLRLVNAEREKAGCSGLSSESRLQAAAQKHSELQAEQNSMSHQLPGEAGMGDRVTAEGYRWRSVAENVAAGYTSAGSVMDGWMNSPGHKANILNCGYEQIGVGLAKSSSGTPYWTQNFASPA